MSNLSSLPVRPSTHLLLALVAGISLVLTGCANQKAAGSDPDDMSAEEHRQAAQKEEKEAEQHREQYDPDAEEQKSTAVARTDPTQGHEYETTTYNPTEHHLEKAKKHERFAKQHRKAAEALLEFEEKHCAKFPEKTRAKCPLMGQVDSVETVDRGAKLHIADAVDLDAITDHMRCHFAFGRTNDHEGMQSCPLYLEGLSFEKLDDDHAVIIRTSKDSNVEAVRQRSRAHVD